MKQDKKFALTQKELSRLLTSGSRAPSGGNVQPWKVKVLNRNKLIVTLESKRAKTFLDAGHFASYLALGAFLENMIITAKSLGLSFVYKTVNIKKGYCHIEIIFTGRRLKVTHHRLEKYIYLRCTNRKIHKGPLIEDAQINKLTVKIKKFDSKNNLYVVSNNSDKEKVADILGKADGLRTLNRQLFSQMLSEIRWSKKESDETMDGIDVELLELPPMVVKLLNLMKKHPKIVNTIPKKAFEDQAKPLLMASSHLCCLTTNYDIQAENMIQIGRAMEYMWIYATSLGLAVHPWTVLPFFLFRLNYFRGQGFNSREKGLLMDLEKQLKNVWSIPKTEQPVFIFRLSSSDSPKHASLRLPWKHFTSIS